jgi:hypothetical protein
MGTCNRKAVNWPSFGSRFSNKFRGENKLPFCAAGSQFPTLFRTNSISLIKKVYLSGGELLRNKKYTSLLLRQYRLLM